MFLAGLLSYAVLDFWMFRWVPLGYDDGYFWDLFYSSYSEVFFHGQLPHWFPYGRYGQPNDFYTFLGLTSTDYLAMLLGAVFRIRDALFLFHVSVFLNHVLFLLGVCLLARVLFTRTSTVWLCAIGSVAFLHGFELTYIHAFRISAWYPLIVWAFAVFFRDRDPRALALALALAIGWSFGAIAWSPFVGLCLLPFVAIAGWIHRDAWLAVIRRRADWRWFALAAALLGLYLVVAHEAAAGIEVIRSHRSSGGETDLESYLRVHDHTFFEVVLSLFTANMFYIGLLPLGCVLWGIASMPSIIFTTFALSVLALVWFGAAGLFAKALYVSVPPFRLIRYLDFSFHLLRAPLLLAAAAAWDQFSFGVRRHRYALFAVPVIALFVLDFALYGERLVLVGHGAEIFGNLWPPTYRRLEVYGVLAGVAAIISRRARARTLSTGTVIGFALLAGLFFDTFGYSYKSGSPDNPYRFTIEADQAATWTPVKDYSQPLYEAGRVQPLAWQTQRLSAPLDPRAKLILDLSPAYIHTYAYAQFDPCNTSLVALAAAPAVEAMLRARDPNEAAMAAALGCHTPKMRLVTQAAYVTSQVDAATALRAAADLIHTAIIQVPPQSPLLQERPTAENDAAGVVTVTSFSANQLTCRVRVTGPGGAWLVYADGYDPRWRAWVNDIRTNVLPADVGLKAVRVPPGESAVRLEFSSAGTAATSGLALIAAALSLVLLCFSARCLVSGFPSRRPS